MAGQSLKKLNRLLEKAEELFMKYGYTNVSVDQIAAEAGISKMTIYKHFHSKEDLFIEVILKFLDQHFKVIMEKANANYHVIDKIEAIYTYSLQMAKQFPPILTKDILKYPSITEKIADFKMKMAKDIWRSILEDGIKKGEVRPLDVDFVCQLLMGLPYAFINTDYFTDEEKISELVEKMYDFMKYGMLGNMKQIQYEVPKEGAADAEKRSDENR